MLLILGLFLLAASLWLLVRRAEDVLRFVLRIGANTLFRLNIEGSERIPASGPVLLVANHISYADPVLIGCAARHRRLRYLMWQPIYDLHFATPLFRILHAIPIGDSPRSAIAALRIARHELNQGEALVIFPEGSISPTGETAEFKRGYEKVLQGTDTPIIPIHISGLFGHPLSYKSGGPFRSWQKLWRPEVTVRVGHPVHASIAPGDLRQAVLHAPAPCGNSLEAVP